MGIVRDPNDHEWQGAHSFSGAVSMPAASITSAAIAAAANISQSKLQHRRTAQVQVDGGADVATVTKYLCRFHRSATLLGLFATPDAVPAGGTKAIVIDVKKSTGGGAWASILSATLTINSSSTARTPVTLSYSGSPTFVEGDVLQVVITASGTGGTGVQGLLVDLVAAEDGT